MRVIAAFDDITSDEASDLGDAFWLADTSSNRKLAEAAWATNLYDSNSAVFNRPSGLIGAAEISALMDDIDLHHPQWREIVFKGVDLTPEMKITLDKRGFIIRIGQRDFALRR